MPASSFHTNCACPPPPNHKCDVNVLACPPCHEHLTCAGGKSATSPSHLPGASGRTLCAPRSRWTKSSSPPSCGARSRPKTASYTCTCTRTPFATGLCLVSWSCVLRVVRVACVACVQDLRGAGGEDATNGGEFILRHAPSHHRNHKGLWRAGATPRLIASHRIARSILSLPSS